MQRYELEESLKEEIRARVLGAGFMKLVQSVRRGGGAFRISMRPVEIGGRRMFQAEMSEGRDTRVKNLDDAGAAEGLEEIIAQKGARDLHLMTAKGDLHVRVTKKGHVLVSRSAEMDRVAKTQPHDRVKDVPLGRFDSTALLKAIGIADGSGAVRASMRGKYDQINEFLRVVGDSVRPAAGPGGESRFVAVDCGCGKAYLTIALYFYLSEALGFENVRIVGVDRREDVVAAARKTAENLDVADRVVFAEADLADFGAKELAAAVGADGGATVRPDLVCSLHACDTATDEALAKGVEWGARYVFSEPCCQHELQKTISGTGAAAPFAGLLRQSILRERLCDILTDSFRAMLMRVMGYKTQVIEFVSPGATARNIMLKCESGAKSGQPGPVGEYLELRDYWKVVPWLETRLGRLVEKHLSRYG